MVDTTSLFVHVLAAIGIVGGGLVQVLSGTRVRAARTGEELATWAGFTRSLGLLVAASAVLSLLSGGHLAGAVWTTEARSGFSHPFITLGMAGLLLLAPVGPMVGGRRLRELAARAGTGVLTPELRDAARDARMWALVHSLLGVGVGLVALMVYKPGWVAGVVVLLVTFALGGALGGLLAGRSGD